MIVGLGDNTVDQPVDIGPSAVTILLIAVAVIALLGLVMTPDYSKPNWLRYEK